MNSVSLAFIIIPIFLSLWICHSVAKKRGLNQRYWHIMAIIFGPFAIPFVFLAKPPKDDASHQQDS